ncbi:MAG: sorbosone dehydrogenase family protein [Acidobacteria bacterium]|nr:sorbosone dehydrogenase family protein [Acidobacteriota bacterium]
MKTIRPLVFRLSSQSVGRALVVVCCMLTATPAQNQNAAPQSPPKPAELKVPAGFKVTVFASEVTNGRLMAVSPDGVLYVPRQSKGDVVALPDRNKDGRADSMEIVASGLNRPHSVAFNKGYLYIATNPAILRMKYSGGKAQGEPEKVVDLPVSTTSHWTRTIAFGKDGKMYVSIGSSCNSCEEEDARRTTIMQYNADGSGARTFAGGLRNAIGFDWDPRTNTMWATDMGQDGQGEDFPPDEINRIEQGKHYGFPYFLGNNQPNSDLKDAKKSMKSEECVPPAFALQSHLSPIGLAFYKGRKFPEPWRSSMYVALHGSSPRARKEKIGYNVVRVVMQGGRITGIEDFVTGFVQGDQVMGRPAGLVTGADGAFYISDDNKGFIYRVSYEK